MFVATLLYNLVLTAVDAAVLRAVRRKPAAGVAISRVGFGAAVGLFLTGAAGGGSLFFTTRLLAYLLFLHGPLVLGGCAWTLRRTSRIAAAAAAVTAVSLTAVAGFAFLIEPGRLEVSRVRVETSRLERPVRVVVLADLQTDVIGRHERAALEAVMRERPDLILLAGDYLQAGDREEPRLREELRELLRETRFGAPLGAFAVEGNVDSRSWPEIFQGLGVICFERTGTAAAGEMRVTGLSLGDSFDGFLRIPAEPRFHIAFGHAPDFALGDVQADLLVAGHTHGGQVRLPGIGPLITLSRVPRSWAAGVTRLPGARTLVVSRGVGMERGAAPRLRFLCRPEIVVIDLLPIAK